MDKTHNWKAQKPNKRRNMEAQQKKELEATISNTKDFGCQVESFVQEDKMTKLMEENALLRDQLTDSQFKQDLSDYSLIAAQRSITALETQLEQAHRDLVNSENKIASLHLKMDMAEQKLKQQPATTKPTVKFCAPGQCSQSSQTAERDISELLLQLQRAQEELEKCTAKLKSSEDNTEDAEQEQQEKVWHLKRGIVDLSIKLQEEQVTLMKKAFKLVPDNTEDESSSQQDKSAQAEEIGKVNLKLQKLQIELLHQALSLKSGGKKIPTKYQWYRTHRDQEQQTDRFENTAESQAAVSEPQLQIKNHQQVLSEEAAKNQKDKDVLLCEIEQLKEKLSAGQALRMKNEKMSVDLEVERLKKDCAVEEAQLKISQLEKELLIQQEHLKMVNAEVAAAKKKAQKQLQVHLRQWQEERASLQETLKEKESEWTKKESVMSSRLDDLECRMREMSDKKSKKKKGWLARCFKCSK